MPSVPSLQHCTNTFEQNHQQQLPHPSMSTVSAASITRTCQQALAFNREVLQRDHDEAQSKVRGLRSDLEAKDAELASVHAELVTAQTKSSQHEAAVTRLCAGMRELRQQLTDTQTSAATIQAHIIAERDQAIALCQRTLDELEYYKRQLGSLSEKTMLAEGQLSETRNELKDVHASKRSMTAFVYGMMALCVLLLLWVLYQAMMPASYLAIKGPGPMELGQPLSKHLQL
jgi:chromosome segregation ATPase